MGFLPVVVSVYTIWFISDNKRDRECLCEKALCWRACLIIITPPPPYLNWTCNPIEKSETMSTVNLNPRKSPNMLTKQGSNQWVRLNVGGSIFLTTKTTLSRDPNSFLARLIQDSDLISDKVRCFYSFSLSLTHFLCIWNHTFITPFMYLLS